jgi:NADH-quinone oxidoreductase subunit G
MVELEIDGKKVEVNDGSMVMDAANKLGIHIPHFCYHKKLSIAANCRMCLVQVEKAPKPMPACATPVTGGMKVYTKSEQAVKAQKGVMEFLLINHPLDCPICDQGGECQLQDLAVGYGGSGSRYQEEKRVVFHKNVGPLVSMEEMSRCIHCTRCVRFGQEIAGVMELGMLHRGEHAEITSFVGRTVDSELSGNMIDICPVGALTSKPFRYSARTWELSRRKSVSPHDAVGANIVVQVKGDKVMRENEAVNECWISDKDRFSYEGLAAEHRLTTPMIKQDGQWMRTDWQTALEYVASALKSVTADHGAEALATLVAPHATVEELYLAQKLTRAMGSDNVDFRLRTANGNADARLLGVPWLGMNLAELATLDRVLVIGSFLRKDQPLVAQRLRQAAKKKLKVNVLHSADDDWLMPITNKSIVVPSAMASELAGVLKALCEAKNVAVPGPVQQVTVSATAAALAANLASGAKVAVFLGAFARQHPDAAVLHAYAQAIADAAQGTLGILPEAGNSVGGYLVNAAGKVASALFDAPRQAYVLLHTEPELDAAYPAQALAALQAAKTVVCMTPFAPLPGDKGAFDYADVLLPVAPFTETAGAFVNAEGRVQAFTGVVKPLGDTRPAWKVLRVLGSLLDLSGFEYDSIEAVRQDALPVDISSQLNNRSGAVIAMPKGFSGMGFERVADVPIYATDALVRRAPSLQQTADAKPPVARVSEADFAALALADGDAVRVVNGSGELHIAAKLDKSLPRGAVRISAGSFATFAAGPMFGQLQVEKVAKGAA